MGPLSRRQRAIAQFGQPDYRRRIENDPYLIALREALRTGVFALGFNVQQARNEGATARRLDEAHRKSVRAIERALEARGVGLRRGSWWRRVLRRDVQSKLLRYLRGVSKAYEKGLR